MSDISLRDFLSADELWRWFQADPHAALASSQTVVAFRRTLVRMLDRTKPRAVLLVGLDGVPHSLLQELAADRPTLRVAPVLSTVPSTSATAWTSLATGLPPQDHAVYGAAIFLPRLGESVFLFDPKSFRSGEERPVCLTPEMVAIRPLSNWFDDLAGRGMACHALGFPESLIGNGLIDIWLRGANAHPLPGAYALFDQPELLASHVCGQARVLLERDEPTAVFAYLNFDWYFHDHGRTPELERAVRAVVDGTLEFRDRHPRTLVLFLSDHGMLRQEPCSFTLLTEPTIQELCEQPCGGAGRILYFYPRPGRHEELRHRLEGLLGDSAEILDREVFLARFQAGPCQEPHRVGRLVAVARTPTFPGAMPAARYEHGGLSRDEMTSLLAWFDDPC